MHNSAKISPFPQIWRKMRQFFPLCSSTMRGLVTLHLEPDKLSTKLFHEYYFTILASKWKMNKQLNGIFRCSLDIEVLIWSLHLDIMLTKLTEVSFWMLSITFTKPYLHLSQTFPTSKDNSKSPPSFTIPPPVALMSYSLDAKYPECRIKINVNFQGKSVIADLTFW